MTQDTRDAQDDQTMAERQRQDDQTTGQRQRQDDQTVGRRSRQDRARVEDAVEKMEARSLLDELRARIAEADRLARSRVLDAVVDVRSRHRPATK